MVISNHSSNIIQVQSDGSNQLLHKKISLLSSSHHVVSSRFDCLINSYGRGTESTFDMPIPLVADSRFELFFIFLKDHQLIYMQFIFCNKHNGNFVTHDGR
ncbi:hypothetical protein SSX86_031204 [Deinandra increscens subsp. villosa]|uniref:Uncharacterized protein n=1 Tax=Deinandra increscens subsp. villosa TaxID=3103831 RepID=A0AAP0GIH1_9ASTR